MAWTDLHFMVFATFLALLENNIVQAKAIFFALRVDRAQRDITASIAEEVLKPWPELLAKVVKTLADIGKLSGRRNDWVHAMWMHDHSEDQLAKVWEPSSPRLSKKDLADEVRDLYIKTMALSVDTAKLADEISGALNVPRVLPKTLAEILSEHPLPPLEPMEIPAAENPQSDQEGNL